jgi:hypothetical protein
MLNLKNGKLDKKKNPSKDKAESDPLLFFLGMELYRGHS